MKLGLGGILIVLRRGWDGGEIHIELFSADFEWCIGYGLGSHCSECQWVVR